MITLNSRYFTALLAILVPLTIVSPLHAELRLSGIFADHMVLQREQPVTVWGWADQGQAVAIQFSGQTVSTKADDNGEWQAVLHPMENNSNGQTLFVRSGDASLMIQDVLIGDVWHACGQSNMAMTMGAVARGLESAQSDIKEAKLTSIRFRRVNEPASRRPMADLPKRNGWIPCSPTKVIHFSAAGFYFARALNRELGVPLGIIDSSRGGTPIEPFIPRAAFSSHPTLQRELELGEQDDLRGLGMLPGGVRARDENWLPARLYHSRLHPISRFAVRGVIWYQAESNAGTQEDPRDYQHKMHALINGWRDAFDDETLPFYFVQLAGGGAGPGWPYVREQQRLSSDLPHSGMVVTIDLLDENIHPVNKMDVGERLARWALADEYGRDIPPCGPMFQRAMIVDDTVTIHFSHAEGGLMLATKIGVSDPKENPQLELTHFELADQNGQWHPAKALIRGNTVAVNRKRLPHPVAVRYAYAVSPRTCRLYNREGLPASPFCSDPALLRYDPHLPSN